jgi:hypothetical protein
VSVFGESEEMVKLGVVDAIVLDKAQNLNLDRDLGLGIDAQRA